MDASLQRRLVVGVLAVAITLALALMLPGETSAAPPEPVNDEFLVEDKCVFPVLVEVSGKEGNIEVPGGRTLFTAPGLRATLTNVQVPANQVIVGVTGALHQRELANGDLVFVFTGRNLIWSPDTDFILTIGRFTGSMAAEGEFSPLTGKGRVLDVCRLLE